MSPPSTRQNISADQNQQQDGVFGTEGVHKSRSNDSLPSSSTKRLVLPILSPTQLPRLVKAPACDSQATSSFPRKITVERDESCVENEKLLQKLPHFMAMKRDEAEDKVVSVLGLNKPGRKKIRFNGVERTPPLSGLSLALKGLKPKNGRVARRVVFRSTPDTFCIESWSRLSHSSGSSSTAPSIPPVTTESRYSSLNTDSPPKDGGGEVVSAPDHPQDRAPTDTASKLVRKSALKKGSIKRHELEEERVAKVSRCLGIGFHLPTASFTNEPETSKSKRRRLLVK